jgi:hypothetical protein
LPILFLDKPCSLITKRLILLWKDPLYR